ncbi:MAG TPA: preprotein translocase subunit YajC [Gemmatimonadaceae bacterium]|jgi:preprotein translocase subunit YajC|nr:MAG: preprotein translocase subunit YajC [Gemmatimonadetes bacterium SCN 70-22]HMN07934.1 preprotein translocase subunit YajC [Gemmatimonadaceae bacterium]
MTATLLPAPFLLQAAGGASSPLLPFLFQIAAIFGIFYFLMIRPQQKQRKQHEARLRNLKRGDTVVTAGGLVGEVVHLKESPKDGSADKSMDDHITIKSGESRVVVERGRVARVLSGEPSTAPNT